MPALDSLEKRIAALSTEVSNKLRGELQDALSMLRDVGNVPASIMAISRMVESERGLLGLIAVSRNHRLKGSAFKEQTDELAEKGYVPAEIASDLHWIRIRANKARHNIEKAMLTTNDAEMAIDRALRIVEWFYCEAENGAKLSDIYTTEFRSVTLQERFAELQQTNDEQARSLQAQIALLHEDLRRSRERSQEMRRDPIPLPLPDLRGTFVDRESECDTLRHLLRESEMRLVVIVAPGGYGKTELTTKFLKEIVPSTSIISDDVQGILYLRCIRADVSLGRIFAEAGRITGEREEFQQTYANRDLTLERKLEFFFAELTRVGNVWLVMDNFEDLLTADDRINDEELRAFIEAAAAMSHNVRLIVTTRAVPRFVGSQRLKPIDLRAGLPEDKAVEYLVTEGADLGLPDVDEELLRRFVNRVHRVPKALESIIGYLSEKYPVVQLSDLMANDALFADFDRYDTENGLKRLIAEQFHDQTPDAQLTLCALSIFPKTAPLAALRFLLPALDWTSVLPRLERNRLINRQGSRYDLHPIVREYAYAQIPEEILEAELILPEVEEISATEDLVPFARLALHERAAKFYEGLRAPHEQWKTIDDLEPQLDEFYHRVHAKQYDDAARVLNIIDYRYLDLWGHYHTLIELREQLEGKLNDRYLQRRNAGGLGMVYLETRHISKSIRYFEKALQSGREDNSKAEIACWLGYLGIAHSFQGETQIFLDYSKQALSVYKEIGNKENIGTALGVLGIYYIQQDEPQLAKEYYEQSLEIGREIDDKRSEGTSLSNLGEIARYLGDYEKSRSYYLDALKIAKEISDKSGASYRLQGIAYTYHQQRNFSEARRSYEDSLALNIPQINFVSTTYLGVLCLAEGKIKEAQKYFTKAINLCNEALAKTPDFYDALYALALAQLGNGQSDEGLATYRRVLKVCSAKGVVNFALQDLDLLRQIEPPVAGIDEAELLLKAAIE
jgi:tetratricopeptide (TPR) repeat protein